MIKKVQIKLIVITMSIIFIIFVAIGVTILVAVNGLNVAQTNTLLDQIIEEKINGNFNVEPPKEFNRCIVAQFNANNDITYLNYDANFFVMDEVIDIVTRAISEPYVKHHFEDKYYQKYSLPPIKILAVCDRSSEVAIYNYWRTMTITVETIGFGILFVLVWFLSSWAVQPIHCTFGKQKRFISDASHELKTPITIISANTEVLINEIGDNQWLEAIKVQTQRISYLINDLLSLAEIEENIIKPVFKEFCISNTVLNCALSFESTVFENNKTLKINIKENLYYYGDEKTVSKVLNILLDNAVKYSNKNGIIEVCLHNHNNKLTLSVFNTGSLVKDTELDKIFERFYRSDASRNRDTGGSGLGLAIAKELATLNNWKIAIENHEGKSIKFIINFR